MTFSRILKELRDEKKLTQQELADELGIARMTINFYESNRRTPDINFAVKAANYFNVSVDYLVGNSNIKSKQDHRYTKQQVDTLEDIIYHLPASASQDLLGALCEVLSVAHEKGIEREMLYLLSMTAYHSKFIAYAEPKMFLKQAVHAKKNLLILLMILLSRLRLLLYYKYYKTKLSSEETSLCLFPQ